LPKLAVIGNLALDRVDGGALRPGGCPTFVGHALRGIDRGMSCSVVTRCAPGDRSMFDEMLTALSVPVTVLPAATTSAFEMLYTGDQRSMTVAAIGATWTPDEMTDAATADWAHVAPVLRSDFGADTLRALAAHGCRVSLDGQGLVRAPLLGPLSLDRAYDPALLEHVQALKLSEEEAAVLFDGDVDADSVARLGVPEVLLTLGSEGYIVFADGEEKRVPAARPLLGVQATGAGDVFMVGYGVSRACGADPLAAARAASELVAQMLEERKRGK
jgi:sugar/nucleoside kinase (ribokinase family)